MGINDNFLDQDAYEDSDVIDSLIEESDQDEQTSQFLSEALRRIEQAKLYEAMLSHQFFSPGSAREEIIDTVTREFKAFIMQRLEILLGIKQEQALQQQMQMPFSEEEVSALKALASRMVESKKRESVLTSNPTVNQVSVQPSAPNPVQTNAIKLNPVNKTTAAKPAAKKPRRPRSQNVSQVAIKNPDGSVTAINQDYSQAVSKIAPPARMPSQFEIDQMNAAQASQNSAQKTSGNDSVSKLLATAIALSQHNNRNIKEE